MITSLDNKTVKELRKLHQKKYREERFLLLDEELISLANEKGYLKKLVYVNEPPFVFPDSLEVSQQVLDKIADRDGLRYIGVSEKIRERHGDGDRVVLLDHLQDPLNIGRIMEGALHFGFDTIVLSEGSADIYNEKCLSVCKGGIFELNICHRDLPDEISFLKDRGYKVYATGLSENTLDMADVDKAEKMAFILGNEGSGVEKEVMDLSDGVMKIDMRNIDSLNVAMAASIIMYRFQSGQ